MDEKVDYFSRTRKLLGGERMAALARRRVLIVGTGGVGGWCAVALVRSGLTRLTLVDSDRVAPSNVNRQAMATPATVGELKVEALKRQLQEINPAADINAYAVRYTPALGGTRSCASAPFPATKEADAQERVPPGSAVATERDPPGRAVAPRPPPFDFSQYDVVVDAIDSVDCKAALIRNVLAVPTVTLFSSMGAARRLDPLRLRRSEFKKVAGDGLARALRQRFKKDGAFPCRPFTCVWSEEPPLESLENAGDAEARAFGSVMPVTAAFGLALASLVIAVE